MTQQQIEKRRKMFFVGISLLATAITMASFGATYAINTKSFADWGKFGRGFALLASFGLEATFALTLFGVSYALVGATEKGIGAILLVSSVVLMATNYTVHHEQITHARLSGWQIDYIQWAGPLSLFGILLLIVGIVVFNHDAQERRLEREVNFAARRKALEWKRELLDSPAFHTHMEQHQPQVFEEVRQTLKLPAPVAARRGIGFAEDADPKAESDRD